MTVTIAIASVLIFIIGLWAFRIVPLGARAISIARSAVSSLRNKKFDDLEREKAVQKASLSLLSVFFSLVFRSLLAFAVCLLPVWAADRVGWVTSGEVVSFLSRTDVILISSVLMIIIYLVGKRLWLSK